MLKKYWLMNNGCTTNVFHDNYSSEIRTVLDNEDGQEQGDRMHDIQILNVREWELVAVKRSGWKAFYYYYLFLITNIQRFLPYQYDTHIPVV